MRDIEPMIRVMPACNWPSLRVREPPQGSEDVRLMSDLRQAPVPTPLRTAPLDAGLEPALVRPSPGATPFGDCLAMALSSEYWNMGGGRQESCQVGGKAPEGQRDKSLMINGGWLRGVDLNHRPSGVEPEGSWCADHSRLIGCLLPPVGAATSHRRPPGPAPFVCHSGPTRNDTRTRYRGRFGSVPERVPMPGEPLSRATVSCARPPRPAHASSSINPTRPKTPAGTQGSSGKGRLHPKAMTIGPGSRPTG